ncbi:MAG: hypothetical protein ACREQ5_11315 [Candidatus Dormibacteria bacterium]
MNYGQDFYAGAFTPRTYHYARDVKLRENPVGLTYTWLGGQIPVTGTAQDLSRTKYGQWRYLNPFMGPIAAYPIPATLYRYKNQTQNPYQVQGMPGFSQTYSVSLSSVISQMLRKPAYLGTP